MLVEAPGRTLSRLFSASSWSFDFMGRAVFPRVHSVSALRLLRSKADVPRRFPRRRSLTQIPFKEPFPPWGAAADQFHGDWPPVLVDTSRCDRFARGPQGGKFKSVPIPFQSFRGWKGLQTLPTRWGSGSFSPMAPIRVPCYSDYPRQMSVLQSSLRFWLLSVASAFHPQKLRFLSLHRRSEPRSRPPTCRSSRWV